MNNQINKLNNEQRVALKSIERYLKEAAAEFNGAAMSEEQYDLFFQLLLEMVPSYYLRRAVQTTPSPFKD